MLRTMCSSQSYERFICEEKYSTVVKRNICCSQDLPYWSGHLRFGRFTWQTVGRNILFGRVERGMNLQLTSSQNLSYRTNTTNDFVVEIQPPINVRHGDMYILVNKIFYPTMVSNVIKVIEENFVKDQRGTLIASGVQFRYLVGFMMPRCCAIFWTRKSNSLACSFLWEKKKKQCCWLTCFSNIDFYRLRVWQSMVVWLMNLENLVRGSITIIPLGTLK